MLDFYTDFVKREKERKNPVAWHYRGQAAIGVALLASDEARRARNNNSLDEAKRLEAKSKRLLNQAKIDFEQAIKLQQRAIFYIGLGEVNEYLHDLVAAETAFKLATEKEPRNRDAWNRLIEFYHRSNQPENALSNG